MDQWPVDFLVMFIPTIVVFWTVAASLRVLRYDRGFPWPSVVSILAGLGLSTGYLALSGFDSLGEAVALSAVGVFCGWLVGCMLPIMFWQESESVSHYSSLSRREDPEESSEKTDVITFCHNCGVRLHGESDSCPECGVVFTGEVMDLGPTYKCRHCGYWVDSVDGHGLCSDCSAKFTKAAYHYSHRRYP